MLDKDRTMDQHLKLPRISNVDSVNPLSEYSPRSRGHTTASTTMAYHNHMGYAVSVIDMNNISMDIPNSQSPTGEPIFIIEYRLNFTSDVNLNWERVLNEKTTDPTVEALKTIVKNNAANIKITSMGNEYIIEYIIRHQTLAKNDFALYYSDLNIVIAKTDKSYDSVHPLSKVGQSLILNSSENVTGFQYRIVINDPYNQFGERYVNINGAVFKVRRTVDPSIKPGVYVHTKDECTDNGHFINGQSNQFYEFSAADDAIPLYGTVHLAASLGDMNYKQTQEIKEKEAEVKERLASLNLKKIEMESKLKDLEYKHKQEYAILERENVRLKDALDREKQIREDKSSVSKYKMENHSRNMDARAREDKAYYEQRSYERKDTNEFLKWIPVVLTGILTIVGLVTKMVGGSAK